MDLNHTKNFDVPESVIRRFFSKEVVLGEFFKKGSKQSFKALIEDMCRTYKMNEDSQNEMTELAYIVFERLKSGDQLANYLADSLKQHPVESYTHLACLTYCILKFDPVFLAKLLLAALSPACLTM